ncbi:MAG: hypothetical protein AAF092_16765 [Pseudomonadota bacterium]
MAKRNDSGAQGREARLKQALKANMARRKAQARARADQDDKTTAKEQTKDKNGA